MGLQQVIDLSATPFFLRGSGYAEGTLFPWTVSDFSLMDAIESGIVKLPRVPVADNIPGGDMPKYRALWENIRLEMPRAGRRKAGVLDPRSLPTQLQTALQALYGHYEKTYRLWQDAKIPVPPCFIIVCNNTSTSKLVYDYVSGFHRQNVEHHARRDDDSATLVNGQLSLFRNFDEYGDRYGKPHTLLIDSEQLESGEALNRDFRTMATPQIEQFRREIIQRTGDRSQAEKLSDEDLLRETMNTVGKEGRLGESIRCVVSVSMLTEGWDANTVTHVLGVPGLRHPASLRAGRRSGPSQTVLRPQTHRACSTSNTPTCSVSRSISPPSRLLPRPSRPDRRYRSTRYIRNETISRFGSLASPAIASSCRRRS